MPEMTMIKKDASISITMGTSFILKLQKLFPYLIENISPEQLQNYKELVEKGIDDFPEIWMDHFTTISILISTIELEAVKQGATYKENIETTNSQDS